MILYCSVVYQVLSIAWDEMLYCWVEYEDQISFWGVMY